MCSIASWNIRGLNFSPKQREVKQVIFENQLSVCAILESHVSDSKLEKLCSHVFRHWEWTSNSVSCTKGSRIILGWNRNDVDLSVITQDAQVIHTRIWLKSEKRNYFVRLFMLIIGDFNAALFLDDMAAGSSNIDISMRDFKECVDEIEVADIQRAGLKFTWSQKPKGTDGVLKKLDRVLTNLEFNEMFQGAHAIFQPYRMSDHAPAVLKIPWMIMTKPKPFKFTNILVKIQDLRRLSRVAGISRSVDFTCIRLDSNVALDMIRMVSDLEIKNAMFSMGNKKSPGPDGFTAAFFKEVWDIVGNDVMLVVSEFFINGKLLKELNHTIIALIPKIIANRIKSSLKGLISPNQTAFVPGRSISDNILLTQELMHNYHLNHGSPRYAFKVDIQKAYDTGKRGLRQGDPLSPNLFTLVMEILTLIIKRRVRDSDIFTYHRYCSKLELVNLCFADDLFLFAYGNASSASVIMEALDEFKHASGLTPSLPKSTTYFCNVTNHVKLSILQILPFEEGRLPVKYLGVPLVPSRLIYKDCKELIEKVQSRVDDWKNKSLSIAGRLQLVNSVIGSLHVFWASVFILPNRILLEIEQIMKGFLWCQGKMRSGKAKVAWEVVCLPKDEGARYS
ncbi:hypothetical protein Tco_1392564 [Tanacetum coccineum]